MSPNSANIFINELGCICVSNNPYPPSRHTAGFPFFHIQAHKLSVSQVKSHCSKDDVSKF